MKRFHIILFLIVLFTACKSDKEKQNDKFVALVENENINNFINIEYSIHGKIETFSYFLGDTIYANWEYNNNSKNFEKYDEKKMKSFSSMPLKYMNTLRNKIKLLNVNLISQTQWHSQVLKFWTGDTEFFTYVHPNFKFDSASKTLLEYDLKNSQKMNDNWYYKKLKVCTNK